MFCKQDINYSTSKTLSEHCRHDTPTLDWSCCVGCCESGDSYETVRDVDPVVFCESWQCFGTGSCWSLRGAHQSMCGCVFQHLYWACLPKGRCPKNIQKLQWHEKSPWKRGKTRATKRSFLTHSEVQKGQGLYKPQYIWKPFSWLVDWWYWISSSLSIAKNDIRSVLLSHLGVLHVSEGPYFHKPSFPSKNLRVFFGNTTRLWVFQKASRAAPQGINGPFIQLQRLHLIGLVSRRKTVSPFRLGVGRYSGIPTNHQTVQIH